MTTDDQPAPSPALPTADDGAISLGKLAADALDDKKALNITLLDVGDLLQITEVFVLGTGTSRRHVLTLGEAVEKDDTDEEDENDGSDGHGAEDDEEEAGG